MPNAKTFKTWESGFKIIQWLKWGKRILCMYKLKANTARFSWSNRHAILTSKTISMKQGLSAWHWFWLRSSYEILKWLSGGWRTLTQSLHSSFDHRFPIEIRGPVHQVEGPKQHWEHNPGHLVNLAHAVVGLLGVRELGFTGSELHRCAVWNGGDGGVLCEVGCIIHTGWTRVVWLFRQSQRVLLLWGEGNTEQTQGLSYVLIKHIKECS